MVNKNREHWLERVNTHLKSLLDKAKRDTNLQIRMEKFCYRRNQIAREKLKVVGVRIEALTHHEKKKKLDILAEASLNT